MYESLLDVGMSLSIATDAVGSSGSNLGLTLRTGDSEGVFCNCIMSLFRFPLLPENKEEPKTLKDIYIQLKLVCSSIS